MPQVKKQTSSTFRVSLLPEGRGLRLAFLSDYQHTRAAARPHTLVVNYPGADLEYLAQALDILTEILDQHP